jgi:hypothetical protein
MNERIRDLAVKADVWCDQNHAGDDHYDLMWEQKFAELIVRECINIADEYDGCGSTIVSRIENYFEIQK